MVRYPAYQGYARNEWLLIWVILSGVMAARNHSVRHDHAACKSAAGACRALEIEVKEMHELRAATVPHVGPYNRISEAFARLGEIAGSGTLRPVWSRGSDDDVGIHQPDASLAGIVRSSPDKILTART